MPRLYGHQRTIMQTFITTSPEKTQDLAKTLLEQIMNNKIVQLTGELGSGKTTFVKGLAKALGIQDIVKSPTYTYMNKYQIPNNSPQPSHHVAFPLSNIREGDQGGELYPHFLVHYDLYRLPEKLNNPERTKAEIGLEETLNDPENLIVIEWAERLPIHQNTLEIQFEKNDDCHTVTVKSEKKR